MARFALSAFLALAAAAVANPVQAQEPLRGPMHEYRDWSVACDNGLQCVAVSVSGAFATRMARSEPGDFARPRLWVRRDAGPDAPVRVYLDTKVWGEAVDVGPLSLHVPRECPGECLDMAYPLIPIEPGLYQMDPALVSMFLVASRQSSVVTSHHAYGTQHGLVSTAGLTAAMRWMEQAQGRAGTVTAVFASGAAAAATVPPAPPRPIVRVITGTMEEDLALDDDPRLLRLHQQHCPADTREADRKLPVTRARLASGQRLLSIGCGTNPYRILRLWLVEWPDGRLTVPPLPRPDAGLPAQAVAIGDGAFDPASGMLTIYTGTLCGWQRRWAWTGEEMAMIDSIEMNACLDLLPPSWLQTYRAVPDNGR